jgi:tetratricopeptide (TPR) repeat protein
MAKISKPLIFISYSHLDEDWLDYARGHLETAAYGFEMWDDRRMVGGARWEKEIAKALSACRVCILLVSRHFLNSDYINRVEMAAVLERAEKDGVHIYPIILTSAHIAADHWLREFNWRPKDGKPLRSLREETDERDKAMSEIVAEIVKVTAAPATEQDFHAPPILIDTSHLPDISLVTLRGRDDELRKLDAAWADPNIHVFSVVAWGGQGKTALVSVWADRLKAEGGRGADAILAWSFYSQGTKERATSADRFLDWALKKLELKDPGPSATLKAEAIAEALKDRRVLLILDGVEPLQHGPGPQERLLKDPAMRILLRRVADGGSKGGLVLVTTRLAVKDIERWKNTAAPAVDLMALSETAGAALLADRGVHGTETQLREASRAFGGHALALTLLSGFLVRRHHGDVLRRDLIGPMVAGKAEMDQVHGHARRVMESMDEEWLSQAPLHAAIMRVVGLFDRPASTDCLEALRQPPALAGIEAWQAANSDARADAIFELREAGLLAAEDAQAPSALDAHPLAREWFGEKLKQENEAGWKTAHGRLYEHLRDTTKEDDTPDMKALEPLFQAIPHGCKAERQQETLNDVYMDRICRRGPDGRLVYHAANSLGGIGPCLSAVAWFFDKPFDTPHVGLRVADRSWVLAEAAFDLGSLGRLGEARDAFGATLEMVTATGDWSNAAHCASNLVECELALGDVMAATSTAARAQAAADRSKNEFIMIVMRTKLAIALAIAGDSVGSRRLFTEAEERLAKIQPKHPRFYSSQGYNYCEVLLSENDFVEVVDRARSALEIAASQNRLLDLGLGDASLGRAVLALALSAATPTDAASSLLAARQHLETAVVDLRRSNGANYIPVGHLARARLFRAIGDFAAARRDLDEVLEIAEPGPMRLHLCDMHLELCRLALAELFCFAPLATTPPAPAKDAESLKQTARQELAAAAKLIVECGYRKRDAERDELAEVVEGKRQLRDLPIRV